MRKTPSDIYNEIKAVYACAATTICELHKPCRGERRCLSKSEKEVLDFDFIKTQEDKRKGIGARSSVDAVTYTDNDTSFCFIEIKGWKQYLMHHSLVGEMDIKEQVNKYDLEKKLLDSLQIIFDITNDNMEINAKVCYIIVTDIDVKTTPLESINETLQYLSVSASNVEDICNHLLKEKLNAVKATEDDEILKLYTHCKKFDEVMAIL